MQMDFDKTKYVDILTQFMEFYQIKCTGLFYTISLTYLPLKVCEKAKKCTQKLENDGIFPKW